MGLYCYLTVDILLKFYRNVFFFPIVAMATERLKCWLKAFIAVYSGERMWPMGLWFHFRLAILDEAVQCFTDNGLEPRLMADSSMTTIINALEMFGISGDSLDSMMYTLNNLCGKKDNINVYSTRTYPNDRHLQYHAVQSLIR